MQNDTQQSDPIFESKYNRETNITQLFICKLELIFWFMVNRSQQVQSLRDQDVLHLQSNGVFVCRSGLLSNNELIHNKLKRMLE